MATPQQYRHKPTTITALEYTRPNIAVLEQWLSDELGDGNYEFGRDHLHLRVETAEGDSRDCLIDDGYRIVRGIAGEFYPVDGQVFTQSYVLVNGDDAHGYARAALAEFRADDAEAARWAHHTVNYKQQAYALAAALNRLLRSLEGDQS